MILLWRDAWLTAWALNCAVAAEMTKLWLRGEVMPDRHGQSVQHAADKIPAGAGTSAGARRTTLQVVDGGWDG